MYLLDTNICIAIINQNSLAVSEFAAKISQCYISTIIIGELYKGAYCSQRVQLNLNTVNQFIGLIRTIDFDQDAALEFGKIQAELRKIGRPTGEIDALIAAVARSQRYILVTNNTRHFINIYDLRLENWLDV